MTRENFAASVVSPVRFATLYRNSGKLNAVDLRTSKEIEMLYSVTRQNVLDDEASVDHVAAPNTWSHFQMPPLFYKNNLGAVTNRRQFQRFYDQFGFRPIGPYIFSRR
jgi:hypothetical protein